MNEQATIRVQAVHIANDVIQAAWRVYEKCESIQNRRVLWETFGHCARRDDCLNASSSYGNCALLVM